MMNFEQRKLEDFSKMKSKQTISLELIESKSQKRMFNLILDEKHYLGHSNRAKKLRYFITDDKELVAIMEWAYPLIYIYRRFPMLKPQMIAENTRFLILRQKRNIGSQILSQIEPFLKKDWYQLSKSPLKLLITYVDPHRGYDGAVYKSGNWEFDGFSKGKRWNNPYEQKPLRCFENTNKKMRFIRWVVPNHIRKRLRSEKEQIRIPSHGGWQKTESHLSEIR